MDYDVAFIGSGHANWHAAIALRKAGKSVVIIEKDTIAGTCTNYGCDPKILLDGPFATMEQLNLYQNMGVTGDINIDWSKLMEVKNRVINPLSLQMTAIFTKMGIEIVMGAGKLKADHTILVNGTEITAENIVLGTGQRSKRLDIPGQDLMHDSRDFLSITEFPKRIVFVGAGIISMEFASMAIKMGSSINIFEYGDRALAAFHQAYSDKIVEKMTDEGVIFHFNAGVTEVSESGEGLVVTANDGTSVVSDYVLDATGRTSNIENLGLEDLGIEFNRNGIVVDDHMRTAVSNIYASGDVVDKNVGSLTPTAEFESNYIAGQILGQTEPINYPVVPSTVFTLPRISQVGVTVAEAEKRADLTVVSIPVGQRLLFESNNEIDADLTLIVDDKKRLIGASMYGLEAGEWINLLTLIINQGLTARDLGSMIFAFPGMTSGLISLITMTLA